MLTPMSEASTTPSQIAQEGPRHLAITWGDGVKSVYAVRELRLACSCARCVDEWTGQETLDPGSVPEFERDIVVEFSEAASPMVSVLNTVDPTLLPDCIEGLSFATHARVAARGGTQ